MDINAGVILDGTPMEVVGHQIFEELLAVASSKKTKSEINGAGEEGIGAVVDRADAVWLIV